MHIHWRVYIKNTLGTSKMWSLYTGRLSGSITWKVYPSRHVQYGLYKQVVYIERWFLVQVWLYFMIKLNDFLGGHLLNQVKDTSVSDWIWTLKMFFVLWSWIWPSNFLHPWPLGSLLLLSGQRPHIIPKLLWNITWNVFEKNTFSLSLKDTSDAQIL